VKYTVKFSEPAKYDMQSAVDYICGELKNPLSARKLLEDAKIAANSLSEFPGRHPIIENELLGSYGIRMLPIHNYLLFYVVRDTEKRVVILRFLYNKRNWLDILSK
jgi:addiction module RelE/StbE family toxin